MADAYFVVIEDAEGMFFSEPEFVDTLLQAREMKAGIEARGRVPEGQASLPLETEADKMKALRALAGETRLHPGHEVVIWECHRRVD